MTFDKIFHRLYELRWVFLICLGINIIVFFYSLAQFPIGNHDWGRMYGIYPLDQVKVGRWFTPAIFALTWFKQVPMLILLISIIFQILSGIAATLLIEINQNSRISCKKYLIAGLIVSLIPYVTSHHYYSFMAHIFPAAQLLAIISLIIVSVKKETIYVIASATVFMLAIATYQSAINTAAVMICGVLIISLVRFYNVSMKKTAFADFARMSIVFILGGIFYKLSLFAFDYFGLLSGASYQLKQMPLNEMPARILELSIASLRQLIVPQPYFSSFLKIIALLIAIFGGISLLNRTMKNTPLKKSILIFVSITGASILMLVATKTQFVISDNEHFYIYRFASSGTSYFYMFFFLMLNFKVGTHYKLPLYFALSILFYGFCINNLSLQRDMVKQNEYDFRFFNRILSRIEQVDTFSYDKKYKLFHVGSFHNVKQYHGQYLDAGYKSKPHQFTSIASWDATKMYIKMEPLLQIEENYFINDLESYEGEQSVKDISNAIRYIDAALPWPHKSAVQILDGGVIVVILEKSPKTNSNINSWKERHVQ